MLAVLGAVVQVLEESILEGQDWMVLVPEGSWHQREVVGTLTWAAGGTVGMDVVDIEEDLAAGTLMEADMHMMGLVESCRNHQERWVQMVNCRSLLMVWIQVLKVHYKSPQRQLVLMGSHRLLRQQLGSCKILQRQSAQMGSYKILQR